MKFALACLIASLSLVAVHAGDLREKPGFFYQHRPRLGHLKDEPFIDLYKNYAVAFVKGNHRERPNDDFRNYMPSAEECVTFFRAFRVQEYAVPDLDQFVLLDACLGYLYESTYQEQDRQHSSFVAEELDNLLADEKLQALYNGTQLESLGQDAKLCVGDLLLHSIQAKNQHKSVVCNDDYLQVYIQFGECHHTIDPELRKSDSYVKILYDLVKKRADQCFKYEIGFLNRAVRDDYVNNPFHVWSNSLKSRVKVAFAKQTATRMYPKPIVKLLKTFQNATDEINLREVHNIIRGVGLQEDKLVQKLLGNMAKGANKDVLPKRDSKAHKADPSGLKTYRRYVDSMCTYFRKSDNEDAYDFATPITRMARLLSFPEVFGMTAVQFFNSLMDQSFESSALYLSVCACNLLTFTEGAYANEPQNGPLKFIVKFYPDTSKMIIWPDAGFY